jgi:rhodanese-related sulfurtransferase
MTHAGVQLPLWRAGKIPGLDMEASGLEFVQNNIWLFLVAVVSGGMLVWPLIAKHMTGAREVGPVEAVQLINRKDALVLDVREPGEFGAGHIVGARNIPLGALEKRTSELEKFRSRPVLVACGTGTRSQAAFGGLKKLGFSDVYVLSGGMHAWQQASLPVEKK